jgi:hypothetical protein
MSFPQIQGSADGLIAAFDERPRRLKPSSGPRGGGSGSGENAVPR